MIHIGDVLTRQIHSSLSPQEAMYIEKEYHKLKKHPFLALFFTMIFLGCLGVDRFYIRDYKKGFIKLGCCITVVLSPVSMVMTMIDVFKIWKATEAENYKSLNNVYQKVLAQKKRAMGRSSGLKHPSR